jgi:hypothetical protein
MRTIRLAWRFPKYAKYAKGILEGETGRVERRAGWS